MIMWKLFLSFLQIGLLSFGGGYASLPLIQEQIIHLHHWINMSEFTDLITISQMTPGPIAVNAATFVGLKIGDIQGAVIATLGCIIPSCFIVTLLAHLYMKYKHLSLLQTILKTLRPAVIAMIATAGVSILVTAFFGETGKIVIDDLKLHMVVIFGICLFLLKKKDMNPVLVMLLAGMMNVIYYMV